MYIDYIEYITGGDDVQQLCEAGEEEFLEILALLGMYSKIDYIEYITGGDDVQQLCEAGEEEFLEIMALVGM